MSIAIWYGIMVKTGKVPMVRQIKIDAWSHPCWDHFASFLKQKQIIFWNNRTNCPIFLRSAGSDLAENWVDTFRNYFRMTVNEFRFLLQSVEADISKLPTVPNPIGAKERLMVSG